MIETHTAEIFRPNVDVLADIRELITRYPPLVHDKHHFKVTVNNGIVTLIGHLKTQATLQWFLARLPLIPGIKELVHDQLYDDDQIRLESAHYLPLGMFLNVQYGTVILTGNVEKGADLESLAQEMGNTDGVNRVITAFRNSP